MFFCRFVQHGTHCKKKNSKSFNLRIQSLMIFPVVLGVLCRHLDSAKLRCFQHQMYFFNFGNKKKSQRERSVYFSRKKRVGVLLYCLHSPDTIVQMKSPIRRETRIITSAMFIYIIENFKKRLDVVRAQNGRNTEHLMLILLFEFNDNIFFTTKDLMYNKSFSLYFE